MQISRIKKIILICVFYFYKHVRIIIVNVTNADVTVYENEKKYENIYVYMYCALTKVAWGNSSLKMGWTRVHHLHSTKQTMQRLASLQKRVSATGLLFFFFFLFFFYFFLFFLPLLWDREAKERTIQHHCIKSTSGNLMCHHH